MQVDVGMLEEPTLNTWRFVRRVVIQNQMNLLLGSAGHRDVEKVQKLQELLASMLGVKLRKNLP